MKREIDEMIEWFEENELFSMVPEERSMFNSCYGKAKALAAKEAEAKPEATLISTGKGYWWCPECKEEVPGARVTWAEFHDVCGHPVVPKFMVDDKPEAPASLVEELADLEHKRWSKWQKWCHQVLREHCPSPAMDKVLARWDKQIATEYKDLTEREKEMDRIEARKSMDFLSRHLPVPDRMDELVRELEELRDTISRSGYDDDTEDTLNGIIRKLKEPKP